MNTKRVPATVVTTVRHRPCPFCGESDHLHAVMGETHYGKWNIVCRWCGSYGPPAGRSRASQAWKKWDERAASSVPNPEHQRSAT